MSALSPAEVTGFDPATFKQVGSNEVGTPADCMTWHQVPKRILWRAVVTHWLTITSVCNSYKHRIHSIPVRRGSQCNS